MNNRIAHQASAIALAASFTFGILASINMLAVQPVEQSLLAAERAASQVAESVPTSAARRAGG